MSKNIRKFTSQADYDAYKANDGWDYPSVSFVETDIDSQVHYNNEFIMRWNVADTSKTPSFYGEISHDWFKDWVDHASRPCRVLKSDHTQQDVYDVKSDGSVSNWSQFSTTDTNYLHMTRIQNVNVGCFQDTSKGIKEIRFNFDKGCPQGFHKWFPNSTASDGSKLWGRYDITAPAGTNVSAVGTEGIDCAAGRCHNPDLTNDPVYDGGTTYGNWRADYILSGCKAVGGLAMTYWEYYVLTMIFSAYYKNFNTQDVFHGLTENYNTSNHWGGAHQWLNGNTDYLTAPHGQLSDSDSNRSSANATGVNQGYRFMHLENPIHGKQWIWGAGWGGTVTANGGNYIMTFDDIRANASATYNTAADGDYTSPALSMPSSDSTSVNNTGAWGYVANRFVTDIDVYGVPCDLYVDGNNGHNQDGSSSTGFYDAMWAYNLDNNYGRVAYLGGYSRNGDLCGGFARHFHNDASYPNWLRRGRVTMNA